MGWTFERKPKPKLTLEERVIVAARSALAARKYVSSVDVLVNMGLVAPINVDAWRRGRLAVLGDLIQGSEEKVGRSLEIFQRWAASERLKPVEARYVRASPKGEEHLRLTSEKYASLDAAMRAQYVSPDLPDSKQKKVEKNLSEPADPVVFLNQRDSNCTECGGELPSGGFLFLEKGEPLCLACANLGELEFLPRGDTALTRRTTKYSAKRAVVVEFSRSGGRYERQGILVTVEAIQKAEEECAADAPERARIRARSAETRQKQDATLVEQMQAKILTMFPGCQPSEALHIARHTALRSSGRVGRSEAGRKLDSDAVRLAVIAAVRHRHTNYDELLLTGVGRAEAREQVRPHIEMILNSWGWGI